MISWGVGRSPTGTDKARGLCWQKPPMYSLGPLTAWNLWNVCSSSTPANRVTIYSAFLQNLRLDVAW
jgi:hypothetical protein